MIKPVSFQGCKNSSTSRSTNTIQPTSRILDKLTHDDFDKHRKKSLDKIQHAFILKAQMRQTRINIRKTTYKRLSINICRSKARLADVPNCVQIPKPEQVKAAKEKGRTWTILGCRWHNLVLNTLEWLLHETSRPDQYFQQTNSIKESQHRKNQ